LNGPYGAARVAGERSNIKGGIVGQRVRFAVRPYILDGIEFGSVGRKEGEVKAGVRVPQCLNFFGSMGPGTIPDDDDRTGKLLQEISHKGSDKVSGDIGIRMKAEEKTKAASARGNAERGNDGHLRMAAGPLIQQWCCSTRAPAPAHERGHHEAALIDKGQPGLQPGCFF